MIDVNKLAKSYGARTLFEDVSLKLVAGSRYGLVGANGSGKTTFLEIVAGDEAASDGSVTIAKGARTGVLRQDRFLRDEDPILEVAMAGDEVVTAALAEQQRLVAGGSPDAGRLAELEDRIALHDGYTLEARASAILEGLGIPVASHRQPLATLSGGFKLRVLLAQVLIGGPDVLLLDEPTNHLDILSIRWLEQFLSGYAGCALVISHDERFLDTIATHILDVDYGTITAYVGNYHAFVAEKAAVYERKAAEIARAEAIVAEKRAWVERFGAKATKARQAQSRLKQIEKIEIEELETTSRRAPLFGFAPLRPSGRDVLTVDGVSKAYGSKRVLEKVSLTIRRGERVAIIGPNGLGKSTLLKIATGNLEADAGRIQWGHETRVGYFPQDHHELLTDPEATPLDIVWDLVPAEPTTYVRGQLGRMLFSGEDVTKKVGSLSGGEAARVVFCTIAVQRPNVLVLDEPTNHLDLESIHALVGALRAFEGALVFVSHDRAFVSALATRVLEVTPTGFNDFPGTYEEYLARRGDDHLDADTVVLKAKKEAKEAGTLNGKAPKAPPSTLSWEEQKKRKNRKKQLPALRDAAMQSIETAEARKAEIHALWCEPGFFERTDPAAVAKLEAEEKTLAPRIEALTAEWESLEKELEALADA
ncbi:MAG TPA: ABC-F family ATP-binding cassette domain-containing protein [Polyangiaceae bacterium]|jgi:ATPase subunit of ABC transporter with duplicated ATPase domains|nr:ABC-F family ATP-binding cassette domain-containing protein [Polyangiaceae bacterium]